eukprot:5746950-Alexandrium_andersonii.AAC.1
MHKRPCSIPQGCPWSKECLAVLTRVWINRIQQVTSFTSVRVLADDLMLITEAPADRSDLDLLRDHVLAVEETLAFLSSLGARVSVQVCGDLQFRFRQGP